MNESTKLFARHRRVLPEWLALYYDEPIELVSGEGCVVSDGDGHSYIDFFGGIVTTSIGYGVEEFVDAIHTQVSRMVHSSTLYLIRPMVELAERITALSGIRDAKAFFVNSGTEATDTALMMCCSARQSSNVLAVRNSYHGRSFAAVGVTGNRSWSPLSLNPFSVSWIHGGDSYRGMFASMSPKDVLDAASRDLEEVIETTTAGPVACLIAEPIQGVGGFVVPPDGFFGALQSVLKDHGILFVSDEVQTGWGRTGEHFWGYQSHGVEPDMLTFAKGLGNGLAIGGIVGTAALIDSLQANSISTFGGNPLSTTGALATLEYILEHDLQGNALKMGKRIGKRLVAGTAELATVGDVRGKGLMIGIDLVAPGTTVPLPDAADAALQTAKEQGLLIGKGGLKGNVLRLTPPMSLPTEIADEGTDRLLTVLRTVDGLFA
ncbi:MAG: aspartate aminotransferase family protein [Acidimicrobiales bacterium]